MNVKKILKDLKRKYPNKNIIQNGNPVVEILCELEPTVEHDDYSLAIVVIDKIVPHHHRKTTEIYEIIRGTLILYRNKQKHILKKGEKIIIEPKVKHWAKGNETWIKVTSHPGWTKEDHYLNHPARPRR